MKKIGIHIYTIVALLVAVILLISPTPYGYGMMWLQPLLFAICYAWSPLLKTSKYSWISLSVLFVTMFIRYVVCPFFLLIGNFPQVRINDVSCIQNASVLMCYEEVLVFCVISLFGKRLLKKKNQSRKLYHGVSVNPYFFSLILVSLLLMSMFPESISRYHFVFSLTGEEYDLVDEVKSSTLVGFIINGARYAVIILIFSYCYKRFLATRNSYYVYLSVATIFVNACIVYDMSRFNILLYAATLAYLLVQLFPSHKQRILRMSLIGGLLLVAVVSWYKMFSEARGGNDDANDLSQWASTLQQYFMGMRDVGVGLYTSEKLNQLGTYGIMYFFNDIISNVMILSKYSIEQLSLIYQYNEVYNAGISVDKIMPNISAGHVYFGTLLSPSVTLFFSYLALFFDKKGSECNRIEFKFLYIFAALKCSVVMMQFYSMILSTLVNTIFVLYLIFKANEMLFERSSKKRINK